MPAPNYSVGPQPPSGPQQADLWFDSSNQVLNVHNGTNFVPITSPAIPAALNASTSAQQLLVVPAVVGSLGFSLSPAPPAGHVALCYDVVANRMWVIGSGGATNKSAAFA